MNTCVVDHEVWELLPEETALRQWIMTWYHFAVSEGYVEPEYELDEATAERLEGFYQVGLTPGESADIVFGKLH